MLLHDFLNFDEILFSESFHDPLSSELVHARVLR